MPLQAKLTGQIIAGPAQASDSFFPSGSRNITFNFYPDPKQYSVDTGNVIQVNSPSSFANVAAIGSGGEVTQASVLYVRTQTPVLLQVTYQNPAGGTYVSVVPLSGVFLVEPQANGLVVGLAIQGSGTVEYWAAGLQ